MNNTCEKAVLYAAGELTADEKTAFETHLKTCASCRAEVALLNKTQEALIRRSRCGGGGVVCQNNPQKNILLGRVENGPGRYCRIGGRNFLLTGYPAPGQSRF